MTMIKNETVNILFNEVESACRISNGCCGRCVRGFYQIEIICPCPEECPSLKIEDWAIENMEGEAQEILLESYNPNDDHLNSDPEREIIITDVKKRKDGMLKIIVTCEEWR